MIIVQIEYFTVWGYIQMRSGRHQNCNLKVLKPVTVIIIGQILLCFWHEATSNSHVPLVVSCHKQIRPNYMTGV